MANPLPVLYEMDHNGNSDLLALAQFPTSRPSFFEGKLYEDQSGAEYVEYFEAREKLLANYHTTIRIPAADEALALATSATPASRCSRCCRASRRGRCTGLGCWQSQSLRNKSRCLSLIGFHAKLSSQQGSGKIWASEFTFGFGLSPV